MPEAGRVDLPTPGHPGAMVEHALPHHLRRAWGVTGRPSTRGPKAVLSLERIVATAVELGDAGDASSISLTGVARRLGVTPNALYRHLGSRAELLVLAREHALGVPGPRRRPTGDWDGEALAWAQALRGRYLAHPWLVDGPVRLPVTPNALTWFEALLEALAPAPYSTPEKLRLAALVDGYVRASVRAERDLVAADPPLAADSPVVAAVGTLLADYDLPLVAAVFAERRYHEAPADEFDFGLACLLAGAGKLFTGVPPSRVPPASPSAGDAPQG
ncbi:TetR/AcrR family transcriptional regulator C-terminal domain-containing protein [Actinomycetes bacterium KLBMP 9759]